LFFQRLQREQLQVTKETILIFKGSNHIVGIDDILEYRWNERYFAKGKKKVKGI
jgi:hypothetical protein